MTQLSTEDVVRNIHESNDADTAGNLKYSTKESIIEDIQMRAEDGIIEPSNAELLIKLINNAENLNEAISIAALGTMYKRTGLYFDVRLEKQDSHTIHYLKKNKKYSFYDSENPNLNRLIIGDNYHALQNLMVMHPEPFVDVIYIDPPYGKDSMGQFAKTNYKNGITRDNLLSQLYPRLLLARQLLKDDGAIFISIDDRNEAYVKCLMDEIFGEQNFVANIVWKSGGGKSDSKLIKNKKEYLLVYSKSEALEFLKKQSPIDNYNCMEPDGRRYAECGFDREGLKYSASLDYPIEAPDGSYIYAGKSKEKWEARQKGIHMTRDYCWTLSKAEFEQRKADNRIVFKQVSGEWRVYYKAYYEGKQTAFDDVLDEISYYDDAGNQVGANEIKAIFGNRQFDYPKPVSYIKWILNLHNSKSAVVLDFYAGSGTTGQAVLELNKEDGGNRTFILCTNNEPEDGYIADNVTTKRLKRVMTGSCYDGTSDFPWVQKNKPLGGSLEVYDICSVANFEMTQGKTPFDVIDETVYGKKRMELQDKIKWVCENFEQTQPILAEKDKEATS